MDEVELAVVVTEALLSDNNHNSLITVVIINLSPIAQKMPQQAPN